MCSKARIARDHFECCCLKKDATILNGVCGRDRLEMLLTSFSSNMTNKTYMSTKLCFRVGSSNLW